MTRFAIIFSVEDYQCFAPTRFAHADSKLIFSTLTERCDYAEQNSLILNLSPSDKKKPSDILAEIRSFVGKSTPGDSILFYFAGHGHFSDGQTFLILPDTVPGAFESTALSLDDISKELREPQRLCFRIFDSCHSGLDVRDSEAELNSNAFIRAVTHEASGWVTLAARREDQFSVCDPQIGHGVFTYYLCDYIVSLNENEKIYPELIKIQISDKVSEHSSKLGFSQSPTLNASISGNISLAIRRADPPKKKSELERESLSQKRTRIAKLREIKDILSKEYLEKTLQVIVDECVEQVKNFNDLDFKIVPGSLILANDVPDSLHSDIVEFSRRSGLQPRHQLIRHKEVAPFSVKRIMERLNKIVEERLGHLERELKE